MTEEIVINASPLIIFSKAGYFLILKKLFDKIYLPKAVYEEIIENPYDSATITTAKSENIIICEPLSDMRVVSWDLGKGETEVISFSLSNPNIRPVLDDAEAKACCLSLGIKPLGTGSILILAKRAGLLTSVKETLFEMRSKGLWISDKVIDAISNIAEE